MLSSKAAIGVMGVLALLEPEDWELMDELMNEELTEAEINEMEKTYGSTTSNEKI